MRRQWMAVLCAIISLMNMYSVGAVKGTFTSSGGGTALQHIPSH